ncbi:uncharacterized protein T551_02407 [Pneumocystis jirovecii RU7]|uniref:DH domain-containing protein n=1 Tax=Pneumocystis jirovecii (strain RU7) TaxID=1408657 RepID=A0A0W4ZL74_PNEJ7|nr:uncharacterized protein T551_02407 [Pneumocystis jirovecii RU7]KTW29133.1 hypothetical protein T551_02407 [Pneumocystis jirovecii RU7]
MTQSLSTKSSISTNTSTSFSKYDELRPSESLDSSVSVNNQNISSLESIPLPTNSITNKPAIASSSIYQMCREIHERLLEVPNFEIYLTNARSQSDLFPAGITNDPVSLLWQCFRQGASLCALYNALKPEKPLTVNPKAHLTSMNACKANVYHFLLACRNELGYKDSDLFSISQLYQDDTNGFVKVAKTVSLILDKLEEQNLLIKRKKVICHDQNLNKPKDNRAKVVAELLDTERKYVQDMETLQNYMHALQSNEIVSADTIHLLFANLNMLVDFQRRFLIGIEANSALQPEHQRFGALFMQMEESFSIYEPFCSNYTYASDLAIEETAKLSKLAHIVEPTYELPSLLIKPIQRICKYPLLLKELLKHTSPSDPHYEELKQGMHAIKRVTDRVNETRRRQENEVVVMELERRVEDWKGHNVSSFGALLLEDIFMVLKGDVEREYHVYLFERILLCCKEMSTSKKQTKNMSISKKPQKKRGSLQLKGRIFINNVSDINSISKNGQYTLQIHWHNDHEKEYFILRCRNEENLKQWHTALKKLIEELKSKESIQINQNLVNHKSSLSNNQFTAVKNFNMKPKNYTTDSDDDNCYKDLEDIIDNGSDIGSSTMSRNPSSISMRSRSTTNDSILSFGNNYYGTWTCPSRELSQTSKISQTYFQSCSSNPKNAPENINYRPFENNYTIYPESHIPTIDSSSNLTRKNTNSSTANPYSFTRFNSQNCNRDFDQLRFTAPPMSQTPHENNIPYLSHNYRIPIHQAPSISDISQNRLRSASNPMMNTFSENQIPFNTNFLSSLSSSRLALSHRIEHNDSTSSSISSNTSLSRPTTESPNTTGNISPSTIPHTRLEANKNENHIKVKVNYLDDIFVIIVAPNIGYAQLIEKVERKIHLCGNYAAKNLKQPLRIRYQDEDGDHITINSDEDVQMAVEMRHMYGTEGLSGTSGIINLYVG